MIGIPARALFRIRIALVLLLLGVTATGTGQSPSPILLLVSFDGWRWDYFHRAHVPHLRALAARGVRSEGLIPSFPSDTFPNHYTIVTGLYPEHHGIIANSILPDPAIGPDRFTMSSATERDGRWWGGEPLWVTAIRQGRRASTMFWPGSDAAIGGVRPTAWRRFDDRVSNAARVKQVLAWMALPERERPAFVTVYFSDVDSAGHDYGPESPQVLAAAARLDEAIGQLESGIDKLGLHDRVSYVVVSDHGMSQLSDDRVIFLDDYLNLSSVDIAELGPVLAIRPRAGSANEVYHALAGKHEALAVYKREDVPVALHYRSHTRIPPIIGLAKEGWTIRTRELAARAARIVTPTLNGTHGYDPAFKSMHGLFVAAGPMLKRGLVVPEFQNIHLYDFMCRILGLTPASNDGDPSVTNSWFIR